MSGLFGALNASSQSLAAFQQAIEISQNNINNSSTPGYAAQIADFSALSFNAQSGLAGGVSVSGLSTRDGYLDESVRHQYTSLGTAQQLTESLNRIQSSFDVSGASGVPGALTKLFSSFSALSVAPGSNASRQSVVAAAQEAASAFQQTAGAVSKASAQADGQIQSQVARIGALASEIQGYNKQRAGSGTEDSGRDARLNAALEKLSSIANITTRPGTNGTTDVLLDGQIPLVLGVQQFSFSVRPAPATATPPANPGGQPALQIVDGNGTDITSHFSGGTVAGLLQFRNGTLAALQGDRNQTGSLNTLAKGFADRVNSLLTSGVIADGPPVQPGVPLFTYDTTDATKTAGSLSVVSGFTAAQIATISPGPPSVSNGTALALANLAHGTAAADQVNGFSYTQFFGEIAGGLGSVLASQQGSADLFQQAATQAQSLRSQLSGVSLDTEAVRLLQYQKAYSASAKVISVLDQITQTTLDILK